MFGNLPWRPLMKLHILLLLALPILTVTCANSQKAKPGAPPTIKATSLSKNEFIDLAKKHPVIAAAIDNAKKSVGAKACDHNLQKFQEPAQMEKGTTYEFSLHVTCSGPANPDQDIEGSQAFVKIEGTWFKSLGHTQTLKIEIAFAG